MTTTDIEKRDSDEPGAGEPGTDLVPAADDRGRGTVVRTALLEPDANPRAEALRTRLLLPLLIPIIAALAIAFYAINLSRVLLAGGATGGLIAISVLTLAIFGGVVWISSQPDLSTGALAVSLAVLLGLIGAAGLTTIGAAEGEKGGEEAAGFVEPTGEPVATLEVDALPTLKFQLTDFPTTAGINEIVYVNKGGSHTLLFDEPEFRGFELVVGADKNEDRGKVELEAGTYTIYCSIPGHRAAGMEATVTAS